MNNRKHVGRVTQGATLTDIYACANADSLWVQVRKGQKGRQRSWDMTPDLARSLATSLLAAADRADEMEKPREIAADPTCRPGHMHPVDKAFYDLTVQQRDRAWKEVERLRSENSGTT